MIQASELRIGNWIKVGGSTIDTYQTFKPFKVTVDVIKAIQEENEERPDAMLSVWDSIKLTPEILEKCGFKKREPKGWYYKRPSPQSQTMEIFFPENDVCHYADGAFVPELKFLHQLQNLYFALAGEELNITL